MRKQGMEIYHLYNCVPSKTCLIKITIHKNKREDYMTKYPYPDESSNT